MSRARDPIPFVIGLVTGLIVLGLLVVFTFSREETWSAEATVVVLPRPDLDPLAEAGYYETLSRGQIVATIAELLRSEQVVAQVVQDLDLRASEARRVSVDARVIPDTSVIALEALAGTPEVAESVADAALVAATSYAESLAQPFRATPVGSAQANTTPEGTGAAILLVLSAVLALLCAVGVTAGVIWLRSQSRRRPHRRRRLSTPGSTDASSTPAEPDTSA